MINNLLDDFWYNKLEEKIKSNNQWVNIIGKGRDSKILPKLEDTFKAINSIKIKDIKIVIFGQDPYPRKESASGIAFLDSAVKSWDSKKLSPSLRNIFKSILINENLLNKNSKIEEIRKVIKENNIIEPMEFFNNSIKNGVLWLNTSLTYSSKKDLNFHLKFWEPIIDKIIEIIAKENNKDLIFILWGSKAKKLKNKIKKYNKNAIFVENCHPMLEKFHEKNNFKEIDILLNKKFTWI